MLAGEGRMKTPLASHILFKIDASRSALQAGNLLSASQVVGEDADKGEPVRAGATGWAGLCYL